MSEKLHEKAVDLLLGRGKNDEALLVCEKAVKLAPSLRGWLRYAEIQISLGYRREVRESLAKALELAPAPADRVRIADLYEAVADYPAAVEQLTLAAELAPRPLEALLRLGRLHLWRGDYTAAADCARRALELDSRSGTAFRLRGAASVLLGRPEADKDLAEALSLDPKDIEALVWRGELRRREGRLDEAMADFSAARTLEPYLMGAMINMELISVLRGEPVNSAEHNMLFTRIPKEIFGWSGLDAAEGVRALENAIDNMKGNRSNKTTFVQGEGDSRRIIEHLHFFPRSGLMNLQATARYGNGRRVLGLFNDIIAESPDEAYPYSHRGEILLWLGRYHEALADFTRARVLNDYLLWPKVGLGAAHLLLGDLEKATEHIELVAKKAPPSIISTWRGELLRKLGRHAEAVAELDKIEEPLPFRPSVWLNKALSLDALGRCDEAAGILGRLRVHAPGFIRDAEKEAESAAPARVLLKALELMRGNRSSWMYGYVLDERVNVIRIRGVAAELVPHILRGYRWAFE